MNKPESVIRSPWLYDVEPFEIVPKVYYVGNTSVSSHLFDTGDGLLLLDTTYAQTGYLLLESIRKIGFNPADIRWIIHSHAHLDHFGATRMLVEKFGCKTYMPAADMPLLNEKSDLNWCEELAQPFTPPYDTWFSVDRKILPNEELVFGNIKVTAYKAAGHTPGTMAYVFTLPDGKIAAMHGGLGWNTLSSTYSKEKKLGNQWRMDYIESLERLENLDVDIVLGNHPIQANVFEKIARKTAEFNPFIDKNEWQNLLRQTKDSFIEMVQNDPIEDTLG